MDVSSSHRAQHTHAAVIIQDDGEPSLSSQNAEVGRAGTSTAMSTPTKRCLRCRCPVTRTKEDEATSNTNNEFFAFPCSSRQLAKQRERFLMFLKVLVKYTELKDPAAFEALKEALRQCAAFRRQNLNEGFILLEMYRRCKEAVSDVHWSVSVHVSGTTTTETS